MTASGPIGTGWAVPDPPHSAAVDGRYRATPVSIIGIGCRVPGARGADEFWRLLREGRDGTTPPPPNRAGTRRGGYLTGLGAFDNDWFAISEREAAVLDPRQRLSLEVAIEAIDDAGVGYRMRGARAAVLFGASGHDTVAFGGRGRDARYAVAGSALSIIANRLSYVLDLHGPSLVLDSAGSSSLAAVDLAVRLLADDTVPLAIVGGVNLPLLAHTSDYLDQSGSLAPDGRCKPFDAAADGYTRSDGCTVLILQRSTDAHREGNRVYAEITGTAVGSDGGSNGLHTPNDPAQQQVIRSAWARAGAEPRAAGYFECHGTGTALDDAVEVGALAAVLSGDKPHDKIWIGSVKSNLGHLEAAAGITGLAKAALSIAHATIVPTINFRRENPLLALGERGLGVPTEPIGWAMAPGSVRYAGVSSFGFGGTNAHVVVREAAATAEARDIDPPLLLTISGRDEPDIRAQAADLAAALPDSTSALRDFAAATGRSIPDRIRAAVLVRDPAAAVAQLHTLATAQDTGAGVYAPVAVRKHGGIVLVFSGPGGQHARMGRALAARYPAFARAVAEATDAVAAAGGPRVWTPRHGFGHGLDTTDAISPALFVYQIALSELLAHWGIRPDAVIGHSLGEIAAAVVSGSLSLADGARVAVARGAILSRLEGRGAMALVEATRQEAERLVEPLRAHVAIAAVNGARSVVVSGTPRYVDTLVRRAGRRHLFAQRIAGGIAAHSPQVRELAAEVTARLDAITPRAPRIPVYSTARRAAVFTEAAMGPDYWAENVGGTVEFAAAVETATAAGFSTVLEVSPHPVLATAIRENRAVRDSTYPVADRDDEYAAFLDGVARLYLEGRFVDWSAQGAFTGPAIERRWRHRDFPLVTDAGADPASDDLGDHVVLGVPTVPAAYWLRQLLRITGGSATRLAEFTVHDRTDIAALTSVSYRAGNELVEAVGPATLASARIAAAPTPAEIVGWMRTIDAHHSAHPARQPLDLGQFYGLLRTRGLEYGSHFRPLRGIAVGSDSAIGLLGHHRLDTAGVDGCLQLIAAAALTQLPDRVLPVPVGIDSAWISDTPGILLAQAHAFLRDTDSTGLRCDVLATDQHGAPAIALRGVHIRYAGRDASIVSEALRESDAAESAISGSAPRENRACTADRPRLPARFGTTLRRAEWAPIAPSNSIPAQGLTQIHRVVVVGKSRLAVGLTRALDRRLPTERVARDPAAAGPIVSSTLTGRTDPTAVVAVWPAAPEPGSVGARVEQGLDLLQRIVDCAATASLTIVLRDSTSIAQQGIAGLVRSLRLESERPVRLVWASADRGELGPLTGLVLYPGDADEVRVGPDGIQARRFVPVPELGEPVEISAAGTYVVTGGLGALGAVAARWLLDAGAGEVVALTRHPRPLPPLLEGLEDRIVVVRCDVADRQDLANALDDIRECGLPIRGLVHSTGALRGAEFGSVTRELLASMFEPKLVAATNLLELTVTDPIDLALLFSCATGALGAPGQAAYAAANATLDALAATWIERKVISIGWGSWGSGLAMADGATPPRQAGIVPFDVALGTAVLSALHGYRDPYVLAMDYAPGEHDRGWSGSARREGVDLIHNHPQIRAEDDR